MGGFHLLNFIKFLFTTDPLCNQKVSVDWWNCLTFLWSSHKIPLKAEQGSESGEYTHKHLTSLPRAIIPSISLSGKQNLLDISNYHVNTKHHTNHFRECDLVLIPSILKVHDLSEWMAIWSRSACNRQHSGKVIPLDPTRSLVHTPVKKQDLTSQHGVCIYP